MMNDYDKEKCDKLHAEINHFCRAEIVLLGFLLGRVEYLIKSFREERERNEVTKCQN